MTDSTRITLLVGAGVVVAVALWVANSANHAPRSQVSTVDTLASVAPAAALAPSPVDPSAGRVDDRTDPVKAEFLAHADEEMGHADRLAKRIVELGGEPNFSPDGLSARSHAEYVEGDTLGSMIREDLIAERVAIESYREMITYLAGNDPTTQRMLKEILAVEEEHADDLASLLDGVGNRLPPAALRRLCAGEQATPA